MDIEYNIYNIIYTIGKLNKIVFNNEPELTTSASKALIAIKYNPDNNMAQIAKIIGLVRGSFTTLIDNLVDIKLVIKEIDSIDRRKYILKLTKKGEKYVQKIISIYSNNLYNHFDKHENIDLVNNEFWDVINKLQKIVETK